MTANVEMQEALDFHAFFSDFRTKKQISWSDYEDQLRVFILIFFNKPGCQRHFEEFDDSFAHLSPDIIHDVVEQISESSELGNLIDVQGTWGAEAMNQSDHLASRKFRLSKTVIDDSKTVDGVWFKERWNDVFWKAPELYGKLHLKWLCSFADKSFYEKLNPSFDDLTLEQDFCKVPYSQEQIEPMRAFLLKQLKAATLKKLHIAINGDLGLDRELMDFCLSDRFESLNWISAQQSPDFFVQIFNAFLTKRFPPDCKTREIRGSFHRSALKEFIQTMKLEFIRNQEEPKRNYHVGSIKQFESFKKFQREERCLVAPDRTISVAVSYKDTARVAICIEVKHHDFDDAASSSSTTELRREGETGEDNVQFEDVDYVEDNWRLTKDDWIVCTQSCELWELTPDCWTEDDCVDCKSCHLCKPDDYFYFDGDHHPRIYRDCDCYPQKSWY